METRISAKIYFIKLRICKNVVEILYSDNCICELDIIAKTLYSDLFSTYILVNITMTND